MVKIEQVWGQYRVAIKAFLHAKISNPTDVEDLLQEILIKSHANLNTVKSNASLKAWVFQIANNTIIDFYRRKRRPVDVTAEDLWYGATPENDHVLSECIDPFIAALPEESAELLRVVDLQGQSQKEYAAEIGVSYSTLKSRVQKARKQLQGLFDECCHFSIDAHGNIVDYQPKPSRCGSC